MYAGEHTAGTEFVIGPLFVAHGVAAFDLVWGLLIGSLFFGMEVFFLGLPGWFIAAFLYFGFRMLIQQNFQTKGV